MPHRVPCHTESGRPAGIHGNRRGRAGAGRGRRVTPPLRPLPLASPRPWGSLPWPQHPAWPVSRVITASTLPRVSLPRPRRSGLNAPPDGTSSRCWQRCRRSPFCTERLTWRFPRPPPCSGSQKMLYANDVKRCHVRELHRGDMGDGRVALTGIRTKPRCRPPTAEPAGSRPASDVPSRLRGRPQGLPQPPREAEA